MGGPGGINSCRPGTRPSGCLRQFKTAVLPCYRTGILSSAPYTKKPPPFGEGFLVYGAPGGIRTPDQVVRSHLLYPAELRVRSEGGNNTLPIFNSLGIRLKLNLYVNLEAYSLPGLIVKRYSLTMFSRPILELT